MYLPLVSIKPIILEALEDFNMSDSASDMQLLIRWATDAARMVEGQHSLRHKLVHLIVQDYRTSMPTDFSMLQQVVARVEKYDKSCSRKTRLSQFAMPSGTDEFDFEVRIICNRCGTSECNCEDKIVELDLDTAYRRSNPTAYAKGYYRSGVVGMGGDNPRDFGWQILKYAKGDFFRSSHFLTDCPNLVNPTSNNRFAIELPNLVVDFPDGEIILSYLARPTDEERNIMIHDHPDLIEGVKSHLKMKIADRLYQQSLFSNEKNPNLYRAAKADALQERETAFRHYRGAVNVPDFKEFKEWVDTVYKQRMVDHNWDENANYHQGNRDSAYDNFLKRGGQKY